MVIVGFAQEKGCELQGLHIQRINEGLHEKNRYFERCMSMIMAVTTERDKSL